MLDRQPRVLLPALRWLFIASLVGSASGAASALFLFLLSWVTALRESHRWLIGFLPAAGALMAWVYHRWGKGTDRGNNLLIDEIHDPRAIVPLRMAPLVLISTLASHLFGGSVGREGTAVQMGGALADQLSVPLGFSARDRRLVLICGVSAGFASVFGTPVAGAVFGMEVLALGSMRYEALWPCLASALIAHGVAIGFGVRHESYAAGLGPDSAMFASLVAVAGGLVFGGAGRVFASASHRVSNALSRLLPNPVLRAMVGGVLIVSAVALMDSTRYIGLGLDGITESFARPSGFFEPLLKAGFTVLTLGSGFKGGEVTPLFFVGSTLGSALSGWLAVPHSWLAALGFVSVFAGAANTPIACTVLAVEVFGGSILLPAALACVSAYLVSGHAGIYSSQRIAQDKALG